MPRNNWFKQILIDTLWYWDRDSTRASVRENFLKIILCGTPALGVAVYASAAEQKTVCFTCKSRFCSSCGSRATQLWQDGLETTLPDIPYVNINFTMPGVLWPVFKENRHLLKDLPAIGASVIKQWARCKYGVRVFLLVVCQTFGGLLNFNCHLHMLVSAGGFQEMDKCWISRLQFDETELMDMWRRAVIFYLRVVLRGGAIRTELGSRQFENLLDRRSREAWSIFVSKPMTKTKYLSYAGRYIRRPPFPHNHILETTKRDVRFLAKDRRKGRLVELLWSKRKLVQALSQHVSDRYRHGMRYFGLLAPQSIAGTSDTIFAVLKQKRRPRPTPLSWPELSLRTFGKDPLVDSRGQRMHRVERLRHAA